MGTQNTSGIEQYNQFLIPPPKTLKPSKIPFVENINMKSTLIIWLQILIPNVYFATFAISMATIDIVILLSNIFAGIVWFVVFAFTFITIRSAMEDTQLSYRQWMPWNIYAVISELPILTPEGQDWLAANSTMNYCYRSHFMHSVLTTLDGKSIVLFASINDATLCALTWNGDIRKIKHNQRHLTILDMTA